MASVVALDPERLVVGSDVNTLVQVNTLLQADSRFIKTLCGLSVCSQHQPMWALTAGPLFSLSSSAPFVCVPPG